VRCLCQIIAEGQNDQRQDQRGYEPQASLFLEGAGLVTPKHGQANNEKREERDQRQHRGETVKVKEGSTGHERDEDAHNWCPSRDLRVILRPSVCV